VLVPAAVLARIAIEPEVVEEVVALEDPVVICAKLVCGSGSPMAVPSYRLA